MIVDRVKDLYQSNSRLLPILFFIGGFLWDAFTLKRIDNWLDHLFLAAYLVGLSLSLYLIYAKPTFKRKQLNSLSTLAPLALQFFLGGLFSAYVVFYFKSASLMSSYVYILLLLVFLFANEILKYEKSSPTFVAGIYSMALFSYFCFSLPVLFRSISVWTFLASLIVTAVISSLFWLFLLKKDHIDLYSTWKAVSVSLLSLLIVSLAYFGDYIPAVPLSLKTGGIYLSATRDYSTDSFQLSYEQARWNIFGADYNRTISYSKGDTLYCFAAVFAPVKLETSLKHRWQKKTNGTEEWEITDELPYEILGGRDGGFRGLSYKRQISPGEWRVDIMTQGDKIIGRIPFEVVEQAITKERIKTVIH